MHPSATVRQSLLGYDGVFRDITFTPASQAGLIALLQHLSTSYQPTTLENHDGNSGLDQLIAGDWDHLFSPSFCATSATGHWRITWRDDAAIIPHLQAFIGWDNSPSDLYEIELSFYPADIDVDRFTVQNFITQLEQWRQILQADDYAVHHEGCKKPYDATNSDVIFTHHHPPLA